MAAILQQIASQKLTAEVTVVISNCATAPGLTVAAAAGVPTVVVEQKNYASKDDFEKELVQVLQQYQVELVVLAGYMRILGEVVLRAFTNRVLNIHPALLPSFKGKQAQKDALAAGVRFTGCTVHFVDSSLDGGPIVLQAVVPVLPGDTEESLSLRILAEEHQLYAQAIQLFAEDRLRIANNTVVIL